MSGSSKRNRFIRWNHSTKTGRVVYNRPRHYFSGRDATRVILNVNNNVLNGLSTASEVNWRFIRDISGRWLLALQRARRAAEEKYVIGGDYDAILDKLYFLGDFIVENVSPFAEKIPVAGAVVAAFSQLYTEVADYYRNGDAGIDADTIALLLE